MSEDRLMSDTSITEARVMTSGIRLVDLMLSGEENGGLDENRGRTISHPEELHLKLSVVVHACNPGTRESEAGGLRFQSHPGLQSEALAQNQNTNN
jgi:hypothetical protein